MEKKKEYLEVTIDRNSKMDNLAAKASQIAAIFRYMFDDHNTNILDIK